MTSYPLANAQHAHRVTLRQSGFRSATPAQLSCAEDGRFGLHNVLVSVLLLPLPQFCDICNEISLRRRPFLLFHLRFTSVPRCEQRTVFPASGRLALSPVLRSRDMIGRLQLRSSHCCRADQYNVLQASVVDQHIPP